MTKPEGMCPKCKGTWLLGDLARADYQCLYCGHKLRSASDVPVRSAKGKVLTPCTIDRAEREVTAGRARWDASGTLWLHDAPEQNAYFRLAVLERDKSICVWCGKEGNTVDHVIPYSEGGPFHPTNLVCACQTCNQSRKNYDALHYLELIAGDNRPSPYAGYVVERYFLAAAFVARTKYTWSSQCGLLGESKI